MNRKTYIKLLLLLFALPVLATGGEPEPLMLTSIIIEESGGDGGTEAQGCQGFRLTVQQVERFFHEAKTPLFLNAEQIMGTPCFLRGTALLQGSTVGWEIRSDGTASIRSSGVREIYLGDLKAVAQ